jgi:alpha-L-rhamnosidase
MSTTTFRANWVWGPGESAPRNVMMQFRRVVVLDDVPQGAQLHISADSRYILYVNGRRIGYGPARAYQFNYDYDTYPLAQHLRVGENVIAVSVSHWGEGTFHHFVGRAGLLAQLEDGAQNVITMTDETWKTKRSQAYRQNTPRIACQLPWEEQFDARLDDLGWTEPGYDDGAWSAATVIGQAGMAPWTKLSPRTIPFLSDEPVLPVRTFALGEASRPNLVLAAHLAPYIAPGDLYANKHMVDALLASVIHVPQDGVLTFKRCTPYGDPPDVLVDGSRLRWKADAFSDVSATRRMAAGEHVVLLDWHSQSHDTDIALALSGVANVSARTPLAGQAGTWAIAVQPGSKRGSARRAKTSEALQLSGVNWVPVSELDTPGVDTYMDITASSASEQTQSQVTWPVQVPSTRWGQAQHYLVDFGREVIGWIELDVTAQAGTQIDLLGFEGIQEGRWQISQLMNNTMRYTCRAGRQTYTSTLRRGFRYLIVALHGEESASEPCVLHGLTTRLATYPGVPRGAFRCADSRLNQIWDFSAYTLRMCSEDTFTDCPTYEQTFWVGDARNEALVHHVVHGDARLVSRNWRLVADSLQRGPIIASQVPSAWEDSPIPNWSWLWAMGCAEHYQFTGDLQFARDIYPALARQAEFVERSRNAAGLFEMKGAWHLLEWSNIDNQDPTYVVAHENCFAIVALRDTASIAEAVGDTADAARWTKLADELGEVVNRVFWCEDKQAYVDSVHADGTLSGVVTQPTNVSALYAGVATGARADVITPYVIHEREGWGRTGSPFMLFFNCEVLARQGRFAELLAITRDRWGDMLDKGATTTWETFSNYLPGGTWTRSWCHAWSAAPAYFLSAYVLGIRPLEPGYKRALIDPQLCDLAWAQGAVPTPQGEISLLAEQRESGLALRIALPAGVAGEVHYHLGAGQALPVVHGAEAEISRDEDTLFIYLPAGAQATIGM